MEEIFLPTGLADPAKFAMELSLACIVVEKITYCAEVFAKSEIAELTALTRGLFDQTPITLD